MRESEPQWVHESDFGAPAFGGVIVGVVLILWGVVLGVVKLFRRNV